MKLQNCSCAGLYAIAGNSCNGESEIRLRSDDSAKLTHCFVNTSALLQFNLALIIVQQEGGCFVVDDILR